MSECELVVWTGVPTIFMCDGFGYKIDKNTNKIVKNVIPRVKDVIIKTKEQIV